MDFARLIITCSIGLFLMTGCEKEEISKAQEFNDDLYKSSEIKIIDGSNTLEFIPTKKTDRNYWNHSLYGKIRPAREFGVLTTSKEKSGDLLRITGSSFPYEIQLAPGSGGSSEQIPLTFRASETEDWKTLYIENSDFQSPQEIINGIGTYSSIDIGSDVIAVQKACPPCIVIVAGLIIGAVVDM